MSDPRKISLRAYNVAFSNSNEGEMAQNIKNAYSTVWYTVVL